MRNSIVVRNPVACVAPGVRWTLKVGVACAIAATGCAQLLGIEETGAEGTAGEGTGGSEVASLQLDRVSIGATLVRAPADLSTSTATFLIEDPSEPGGFRRIAGVLADSKDRWTADIPGGTRASIELTLPEYRGARAMYSFPQRTIKSLVDAYEHPDMQVATPGGTFMAGLSLPSAYVTGQRFQLTAIGPWVEHKFVPAELPVVDTGATKIAVSIPYNAMGFPSIAGARPTPKLTTQDRIVALRYVGDDLTAASTVTPFDQTGGTQPVQANLVNVPHAPINVNLDHRGAAMRVAGTTGEDVFTFWSVTAAPAAALGLRTGIVLNEAYVAATDSGSVPVQFGNPFASLGWSSVFWWYSVRSRVYRVPNYDLELILFAGLEQAVVAASGLTLDQPASLPLRVSINQMPLNDSLTITLDPSKAVELSLVADRETNPYNQWDIYEVVPNSATAPTALASKLVYTVFAAETSVRIPHDVLVAGKVYRIRARCIRPTFPMFSSGDLQNRGLPWSEGYLDAVVTVKAP